jgi:hypothetical protein
MMTVRHNERKCACNVAANEQNGRERPALMNSLQISSMCDPSLGEAGDARRATSPSRLFDGLSAAKTLNERIGFRIRTQKRKEFFCGVEILSFPFSAIRVSACSSSASLLQGFSSRMRLSFFCGSSISAGTHRLVRRKFASIVDFGASSNGYEPLKPHCVRLRRWSVSQAPGSARRRKRARLRKASAALAERSPSLRKKRPHL